MPVQATTDKNLYSALIKNISIVKKANHTLNDEQKKPILNYETVTLYQINVLPYIELNYNVEKYMANKSNKTLLVEKFKNVDKSPKIHLLYIVDKIL